MLARELVIPSLELTRAVDEYIQIKIDEESVRHVAAEFPELISVYDISHSVSTDSVVSQSLVSGLTADLHHSWVPRLTLHVGIPVRRARLEVPEAAL